MSFIGNTPELQNFAAGADRFSGDSSTTKFTLSRRVNSANDVIAVIESVIQDPFTAYTIAANNTSGTTDVTFTSAPPTNSNNIVINFRATQIVSYNQVTSSQIVPTGVSAGTYGGTTAIPVIVVNSQGQVTSASNSSINLNAISGDLSVTGNITATKAVTSNNGIYTSNNYNTTLTTGVVMDYVSGNGRISVPTSTGLNFYNGGLAATQLASLSTDGSLTVTANGAFNGTGALRIPIGTTAQRPSSTANAQTRINSTLGILEAYYNNGWYALGTLGYPADILLVAGGGGSGVDRSAGSGAGGYRSISATVAVGSSYTVTVGAGGSGGSTTASYPGNNGSPSSLAGGSLSYAATGGSYGAHGNQGPNAPGGSPGGSGGGGMNPGYPAPSGNAGGYAPVEGYPGGYPSDGSSHVGGGGGAGGSGGTSGSPSGDGGPGATWYNGSTYAGGGGGGGTTGISGGAGGPGGGAAGNPQGATSKANATTNTGGGGGGANNGGNPNGQSGGNGGSGIVIIRYQSASQLGSGGTVTSAGGYYYHTFTTSGTFTA